MNFNAVYNAKRNKIIDEQKIIKLSDEVSSDHISKINRTHWLELQETKDLITQLIEQRDRLLNDAIDLACAGKQNKDKVYRNLAKAKSIKDTISYVTTGNTGRTDKE